MTQDLFIPGPMPGMNEIVEAAKGRGGRGLNYAKMKEIWTLHVFAHARAARLKPYDKPVRIDFLWLEPDQRRDPDNVATARKFVMDGLVAAGVLRNDRWAQVAGWTDDFRVAAARALAGVRITIYLAE